MNHEDFITNLPNPTRDEHPVKVKFTNDVRSGKRPMMIHGIFGEWKGCDGFVEEVIHPKEGGTLIKIYGCSYLFKGYPDDKRVHGIEFAKWFLFRVPQEIMLPNIPLVFTAAFYLLFARKRLLTILDKVFDSIDMRVTKWHDIPVNEYNAPVKELRRAVLKTLPKGIWGPIINNASKFGCLFIESDSAYRYRLQDGFGSLVQSDGLTMFFEGIKTMMTREVRGKGIPQKWRFYSAVFHTMFFFFPELRLWISRFMEEVDWAKVKMDEADFYFCLRYKSYNFRGLSTEQRFALRDSIDREKGHVFLI